MTQQSVARRVAAIGAPQPFGVDDASPRVCDAYTVDVDTGTRVAWVDSRYGGEWHEVPDHEHGGIVWRADRSVLVEGPATALVLSAEDSRCLGMPSRRTVLVREIAGNDWHHQLSRISDHAYRLAVEALALGDAKEALRHAWRLQRASRSVGRLAASAIAIFSAVWSWHSTGRTALRLMLQHASTNASDRRKAFLRLVEDVEACRVRWRLVRRVTGGVR